MVEEIFRGVLNANKTTINYYYKYTAMQIRSGRNLDCSSSTSNLHSFA